MKIVFMVGFYDTVRNVLEEKYPTHFANGSLVFIRQSEGKPIPDLQEFNSKFSDVATRCSSIKVILATLKNYEWVVQKVQQVIDRVHQRHPHLNLEFLTPPMVQVGVGVAEELIAEIEAFGLPTPDAITSQMLEKVLGNTQVLCIGIEGKASFSDSLRRAGFPGDAVDRFFIECPIAGARNSNLMSLVTQKAKQCEHFLYAWGGLRTLKSDVKKKFSGRAYEAETAPKVIELFRKWVVSEYRKATV